MSKLRFGVSPAFLLSLYGDDFLPEDVVAALDRVKALGFDCFQCELVTTDKLPYWEEGGGVMVAEKAREKGLGISQMVAHFMLTAFEDEEVLYSDFGLPQIGRLFHVLDGMGFHGQVTVPIGPYVGLSELSNKQKEDARQRLIEKLRDINALAIVHDDIIALEVQPGALISGGEDILEVTESVGLDVGYNYDTGHAWASGEKRTAELPLLFGRRMYGTHLCDNDGHKNLSLAPGKGNIDWDTVIASLLRSGYTGSLDLEIFTTADLVNNEYSEALAYVASLAEKYYKS